jgi:pimeloyl-ACP methyl ester carboxylesterase
MRKGGRRSSWRWAVLTAAVTGAVMSSQAASLTVGLITLHRCQSPAPWCGTLERPFDPTGRVPGRIPIYFEFFPHEGPGPSQGTLVATEGGPGYPATDSRDEYLQLFAPLRAYRDVVLMDNRGTGRSRALECQPLQTDATLTELNIAQCGRSLGERAGWYSVTAATDDLAAILEALGSRPIDLYGDSYGTFFEQVFAVRHPEKLRSLILDGAYPMDGPDYAWYPNYAPAMREKFNLACARSAQCSALPGNSMEHIAPALTQLRRDPVAAAARDADGRLRRFIANAAELATVMFGSAPAYASVRELDAAARAYVGGDSIPLFRLMAETKVEVDSRDATQSASKFSAGLAAAVTCGDAPQIFDMRLDPERRRISRDVAIDERKRSAGETYAPFTIDEYRKMPLDYAFIDECVSWPAIEPQRFSAMAALRMSAYPPVPALIISGDLDNMTPVADGAMLSKRFPRGRQIVVTNGFHVNALPHSRSECPAEISRHFIETLDVGDTSCLHSIAEVRLVSAFVRRVRELPPADALSGNQATSAQLQSVTGAVLTVGDAIARIASSTTGRGKGLRGGSFAIASAADGTRVLLNDLRWAEDLGVSGNVFRPLHSGAGAADIVVVGPDGRKGTLSVRWREGESRARARVTGNFGATPVVAETAAP